MNLKREWCGSCGRRLVGAICSDCSERLPQTASIELSGRHTEVRRFGEKLLEITRRSIQDFGTKLPQQIRADLLEAADELQAALGANDLAWLTRATEGLERTVSRIPNELGDCSGGSCSGDTC